MPLEMQTHEKLKSGLLKLSRRLTNLSIRTKYSLSFVSDNFLHGPFLSNLASEKDIDPGPPRVFRFEDDPGLIDTGRLPLSVEKSLVFAAFSGELRIRQFVRRTESEFIIVVDLSRSMLSGRMEKKSEDDGLEKETTRKIKSLYNVVCAFISIAEMAGFGLRIIYVKGWEVEEDRVKNPRDFAQHVMQKMNHAFVQGCKIAERNQAGKERFLFSEGLRTALAVRMKSIVIIMSDFLDPLKKETEHLLAELMVRHRVHLIDLAREKEINFPTPGLWDMEARRIQVREGPWHLEDGTEPRGITKKMVKKWNRERAIDRGRIRTLTKKNHAFYHTVFRNGNYMKIYERALNCIKINC